MAKAKVGKIDIKTVNGVDLKEPLKLDIFFEGKFFAVIPEYLIALIKPEDRDFRYEGKKMLERKKVPILIGDNPRNVETKLYRYLDEYFNGSYKEEKIIYYKFRFNSSKHYMNHDKKISFADTPAMSLDWGIHFLVTFPDGRQTVLSAPYERYGSLCTNKFDKPLEKYSKEYKWIHWSEEREQFFVNTEKSMENLIEKVNNFFNQEPLVLANAVDNMPKLIG